ncbi:MAG: helix-turn-helix transcriptional regulator [Clostridia bacterium]|nr:helix-turn-helix transcriptional regulator [Clostridia bacterium]
MMKQDFDMLNIPANGTTNSFGDKCKYFRTQLGFTQKQMAKKLNISLRSITAYETEGRIPTRKEVLDRMAEVFGVDKRYLLDDDFQFDIDFFKKASKSQPEALAEELLQQMNVLFAGGSLDETTKDEIFKAFNEIYFRSKKKKESEQE